MQVYEMIERLRETSSSTSKVGLLRRGSTPSMRKVLEYAYSPYKKYGFGDLEDLMLGLETRADFIGNPTDEMFDILDRLAAKPSSNRADYAEVVDYAETNGILIFLVATKDLRCGISASTINKAITSLIPVFKVQLAKEVPLCKLNFPLFGQIKLDGVRVIALCDRDEETVRLYTRNGHEINSDELSNAISYRLYANHISGSWMLDGELISTSGKPEDRTKISGLVNSAIKGGKLELANVRYACFDCMSLKEFNDGKSLDPFWERTHQLAHLLQDAEENAEPVYAIGQELLVDADAAQEKFETYLRAGYEGLVLKAKDSKYEFKRSPAWVKMKAIKTADLQCVMTEKGTGKYADAIGALVCTGLVEGKTINVSVGSGLSDAERLYNPANFLEKTVEVKYNAVIPNAAKNGYTLFLPRFVAVRVDK